MIRIEFDMTNSFVYAWCKAFILTTLLGYDYGCTGTGHLVGKQNFNFLFFSFWKQSVSIWFNLVIYQLVIRYVNYKSQYLEKVMKANQGLEKKKNLKIPEKIVSHR